MVKRLLKLCIKTILVSSILTILLSGAALAANNDIPMGPAPNSGDGISDGSGLVAPNGPNIEIPESVSVGPAPNSGDGVPDGSGF